jgi:hypothetical protein
MKIHPSILAVLIWLGLILGCTAPSSEQRTAKEQPSPTPGITADSHAKLVWAQNAIRSKQFSQAIEQLEQIPESAPEYKEAQTLLVTTKKAREEQRRKEAPAQREILRAKYERLVQEANPNLNFIQSKFTKIKGGYALWATHEYFSQYTFSIGPNAKIVQEWIGENRTELLDAEIVRVGVMGRGGFSGYTYFDVR